jgi:hypothetical protein
MYYVLELYYTLLIHDFYLFPLRRIIVFHGAAVALKFLKTIFFDNAFGNLLPLKKFLSPLKIFLPLLNCLINFIEKKIFNIVHNEIIIQRYQNIKFRR